MCYLILLHTLKIFKLQNGARHHDIGKFGKVWEVWDGVWDPQLTLIVNLFVDEHRYASMVGSKFTPR